MELLSSSASMSNPFPLGHTKINGIHLDLIAPDPQNRVFPIFHTPRSMPPSSIMHYTPPHISRSLTSTDISILIVCLSSLNHECYSFQFIPPDITAPRLGFSVSVSFSFSLFQSLPSMCLSLSVSASTSISVALNFSFFLSFYLYQIILLSYFFFVFLSLFVCLCVSLPVSVCLPVCLSSSLSNSNQVPTPGRYPIINDASRSLFFLYCSFLSALYPPSALLHTPVFKPAIGSFALVKLS